MPKQHWSIVTISTCFQGVLGQLVPTSQKVYLSDNLSLLVKCPRLLRPQCGNLIANVVHLMIRTSIVASLGIDQQPGGLWHRESCAKFRTEFDGSVSNNRINLGMCPSQFRCRSHDPALYHNAEVDQPLAISIFIHFNSQAFFIIHLNACGFSIFIQCPGIL